MTRAEANRKRCTIHGLSAGARQTGKLHPLYNSWRGMVERCTNPNHKDFHSYGGRGIKVCAEWLKGSAQFVSDMMPTWSPGMTIDRKDVNADYCKDNCRWIPMSEQTDSRRCVRKFHFRGEEMTLKQLAKLTPVKLHTLRQRVYMGWSFERVMAEAYPA